MFLRLLEPLTHASFTGELITFHGGLLKTQLELSSWAPGQTALSNLLYFTPLSTHCFSSITALWGALLLGTCSQLDGASLLLPVVKKKILLPMQDTQETQVWSLVRRSPGEGKGYSLQYSCLENPMDRGACRAIVRGVAKSQTQLSNKHTHIII